MRIIKWVGVVVVTLAVVAVAGLPVLKSKAMARFDQQFDIPVKDLPVPFPLSPQELAAVGADELVDVAEIAYRRALQRGEHYLKSRAACADCHGADYGGDVIADNPVLGRWVAPNITRGGVTADYTSEDWVRLIRHGVKPDGRPATMPSGDFTNFSDQEISDIVTYIESLPAIDRVMPPTVLGPAMAIMILNGEMAVSAEVIDHTAPRPVYPPAIAPTLELGAHLANTCTGCHGNNLSGGPIAGGDPS
ncbi:MAG: c-type cytochrome, partial [Pseudomonadales bacterium]